MDSAQSASVDDVLREVDAFFMKTGSVHDTLRRLVKRLVEEQIDYAIIGGMALALHGFVQPTLDVDLLMTRDGLERFAESLVGRGYIAVFPGARRHFRDSETGVPIEVITTGEYPGDGHPKAVAFPDPAKVAVDLGDYSVVGLECLIELKLASGLSAEHRRLRDLADVQQLIETLDLPLELSTQLNPSVSDEYIHLWQLAQQASELDSELLG